MAMGGIRWWRRHEARVRQSDERRGNSSLGTVLECHHELAVGAV